MAVATDKKSYLLDGKLFERLVKAGVNNLKAHVSYVNDLNVFPIPDGDTGDNMLMTIKGGLDGLNSVGDNSVCKKAKALADSMLLSARGNSGVILSQLFAGLAKGVESLDKVTVAQFILALKEGVKKAYSSVIKPVEGTILTVARESANGAQEHLKDGETFEEFFNDFISQMETSLAHTPDLLPVLKEADVIDSGGAGLLCIVQGMRNAVLGEESIISEEDKKEKSTIDLSAFTEDDEMVYGYCTECLLRLQNSKVDVTAFDEKEISDYLETIGDSVVAVKQDSAIKIHVHTQTPEKVIEFCRRFGEMLTVKIENMTLQHNAEQKLQKQSKKISPRKKFGLVTVCMGEGLAKVFAELGADVVISGGQCKNPSIESFVEAFDQANADVIFVLPNNGNVIMSAKQAGEIYTKSDVRVIETKNLGQAYSILSMLDYSSDDADLIVYNMKDDMQNVVTGMITTSVRDAVIDGVDIKKGEYIGFIDKKMLVSAQSKIDTMKNLLTALHAEQKDFVIAVYGAGITDAERKETAKIVSTNYPNVEFYEIEGGQAVYDYILILE